MGVEEGGVLGFEFGCATTRSRQDYATRQEVTTTTVMFPSTSRDVLSGEENRAELLVKRAEGYRWSSYPAHGRGETNELFDQLVT